MWETLEKKRTGNYDSCVVELPKEFALANGLPEKCFVSLTLRNGCIESEIIEYNCRDEAEVTEFLLAFPNLNAELKRLGD